MARSSTLSRKLASSIGTSAPWPIGRLGVSSLSLILNPPRNHSGRHVWGWLSGGEAQPAAGA
jgi:hypothetical protein